MAEGRMLKKRISKSRKFAGLQTGSAKLLYLMMLPHLDSEGRMEANHHIIKGTVCPYDVTIGIEDIPAILLELNRSGLIELYDVEDEQYIQYDRFDDFNRINKQREAASHIPAPEGAELKPKPEKKISISFDFKEGKFSNIPELMLRKWVSAYPAVDIAQEMKKVEAWLMANPAKKKKDYGRFLTNWFSRTQEKGGTKNGNGSIRKEFETAFDSGDDIV